ncbi:MAG: nucleotidyltransferase domain-containing protein [Puniceicoccaceae bacterium]|nr:MAG: nucleotidyltransferase domain-containing protein [Puniceicoccaceae bacterium]
MKLCCKKPKRFQPDWIASTRNPRFQSNPTPHALKNFLNQSHTIGNPSMQAIISKRIKDIQQERNCRILFACESGSRAWGFPSPNSDYDARFVYVHPLEWYLQITERKDTIERMLPDDLDLAGWELRKTLHLFSGCNLALNEWIGSPLFYTEPNTPLLSELRALIPAFFNSKKATYHYLSMAQNTMQAEWSLDNRIKIKKLFYILRPLCACRWIANQQSMPPTHFPKMLEAGVAPRPIETWIRDLIHDKASLIEGETIHVPEFAAKWIHSTIEHALSNAIHIDPPLKTGDVEALNQTLRREVLA